MLLQQMMDGTFEGEMPDWAKPITAFMGIIMHPEAVYVGYPIRVENHVIGSMCFLYTAIDEPTEEQNAIGKEAADEAGAILTRLTATDGPGDLKTEQTREAAAAEPAAVGAETPSMSMEVEEVSFSN